MSFLDISVQDSLISVKLYKMTVLFPRSAGPEALGQKKQRRPERNRHGSEVPPEVALENFLR